MEVNGWRQKRGVDVKFASKLDFSTEALVAYPSLRPLCLHNENPRPQVSFLFEHFCLYVWLPLVVTVAFSIATLNIVGIVTTEQELGF